MSNESRILANRLAFLSDNLGNTGERVTEELAMLLEEDIANEEAFHTARFHVECRTDTMYVTEQVQQWVQESDDYYWNDQAILSITGIHD